jgi:hypothetical protein
MEIAEASILMQKFGAKNQIPLLDQLWKAEARLERSFAKAQRELEHIQKSSRTETVGVEHARPAQPEAAADWRITRPTWIWPTQWLPLTTPRTAPSLRASANPRSAHTRHRDTCHVSP